VDSFCSVQQRNVSFSFEMKLVSNEILAVRKIKNAMYILREAGAVRRPYKEAGRMRWRRKRERLQLLKRGRLPCALSTCTGAEKGKSISAPEEPPNPEAVNMATGEERMLLVSY
jgi:hypothetical protein